LADDPHFATNAARVGHREELLAHLEPLLASRGRDEWIVALERASVPCGPVHDLAEVFAEPQIKARGMHLSLDSDDGAVPQVANPLRMSATPPAYRSAPPRLGADTRTVLSELLGLGKVELDTLKNSGVIQL
jgi:crotonobetainyl-CoA:carnitine CoA-transferase CaiB-like acyl-CoA transferase